jgi:hypothetical protein
MTKKTTQIIVVIVIIVVAFLGFKTFFGTNNSDTAALVAEGGATPAFVDGQTILVLLNKLNRVTLDGSIFSDKAFTSLRSSERELDPQVSGRQNPFQAIGVDGVGTVGNQSSSTVRSR